jgi:lipopolysaccharide-induced tumor necrosis factor-alpha factor
MQQPVYYQQPFYGMPLQPMQMQPMQQQQQPGMRMPQPAYGGPPGTVYPMQMPPGAAPGPTTVIIAGSPAPMNAQGAILSVNATRISRLPVQVQCPRCGHVGFTRTTYVMGAGNWIWCAGLAMFGCWMGCCLIPLGMDAYKDTTHHCTRCNSLLGTREYCDCM